MDDSKIGVLGASSLVGRCILSQGDNIGQSVVAFSRDDCQVSQHRTVEWRQLPLASCTAMDVASPIMHWICVAPIWILPGYFSLFEACGAKRVVALSSTSRYTKINSRDLAECHIAARLREAEAEFQTWAVSKGIEWVVLRPTLIYGHGCDKNISEIARFIRRFAFFPLFGSAKGLRQPVHADDVATACMVALKASVSANRAYNLSGGETLAYREVVARVFSAMGLIERVITVPLWAFHLGMAAARCLPRYRHWSASMAERMNQDLVFDHTEAAIELGFKPRQFSLTTNDLPS